MLKWIGERKKEEEGGRKGVEREGGGTRRKHGERGWEGERRDGAEYMHTRKSSMLSYGQNLDIKELLLLQLFSIPLLPSLPSDSSVQKPVSRAEVHSRQALEHFESLKQLTTSSAGDSVVDMFVHKHAEVRLYIVYMLRLEGYTCTSYNVYDATKS